MRRLLTIFYTLLVLGAQAQNKIGIIDFYGNDKVSPAAIREKLGLKEGDSISRQQFSSAKLLKKLKAIPGVLDAEIEVTCCDNKTGGQIVYVGIAEDTSHRFTYRKPPPKGKFVIILPPKITDTYQAYMKAMTKAVQEGRSTEDHNTGYALMHDSAARKEQFKFVDLSHTFHLQLLITLRESILPEQRAMAAMVTAYAVNNNNIEYVMDELLYAIYDSNEEVRNNGTRALWVLADYLQEHPEEKITIPATPFVKMINSLVWTDRNKGSLLLFALTRQRDPALLATLKKEAFTSLCEMARWKNTGHALQAYLMIARIAGVPDGDAFTALMADNRSAFLENMIEKILRTKE